MISPYGATDAGILSQTKICKSYHPLNLYNRRKTLSNEKPPVTQGSKSIYSSSCDRRGRKQPITDYEELYSSSTLYQRQRVDHFYQRDVLFP